mgnify:CR=1 FL=1
MFNLKSRKILAFGLVLTIYPTIIKADYVDEAAKCSATFRVLTSIEILDPNLGEYFTKLSLLSYDLTGLYSKDHRGVAMTNGEVSELITDHQLSIDSKASNGSSFVPYVKSCMGWLYKVGQRLQSSGRDRNIQEVLLNSPTPSLTHEYPHPDWGQMEQIFYAAYKEWEGLGKVTPRSIRDALK